MNLELNDKSIIVSGGSQGLGLATAIELAREGANVTITSRSQENVDQAVSEIIKTTGNKTTRGYAADMTDEQAIQGLINDVIDKFGRLDAIVTNTSGPKAGTFENLALADVDASYNLIVKSAVQLIQASLPHLKKSDSPSILTITSVSTKQPIAGLSLSNIFRPAVIGLTKSLSQELAADGIRVNSILPGWTATERTKALIKTWATQNGTSEEQEFDKINKTIPLQRFANPEEFGRTAAFLLSPAASYITGAMLQVDGGAYAGLL